MGNIKLFLFLLFNFFYIARNESLVSQYNDYGTGFFQMVQYANGNYKGESLPSFESANPNPPVIFNQAPQINRLSNSILSNSMTDVGSTIMIGVNPAYFNGNEMDTPYYMSQLQNLLNDFESTNPGTFQNMIFNRNIGIVNLSFMPTITKAKIDSAINAIFTENNMVWLIESDVKLNFGSTTSSISNTLLGPVQINTKSSLNQSPTSDPSCPNPTFTGPYSLGLAPPNDYFFLDQWYLESRKNYDLDALRFWQMTKNTDNSVTVAVIDSGLDTSIRDFQGMLWENPGEIPGNGIDDDGNGYIDDYNGWNFITNSNDINPTSETHGTMCSGLIAAKRNDANGMAGISSNARIAMLAVLSLRDSISAIDYSISMRFPISSNSWGIGPFPSYALYTAIEQARSSGQLYLNAAGNDGQDINNYLNYPARFNLENMLNVGSSNIDGNISSFSTYGIPAIHVMAPGECILTSYSHESYDLYAYGSGTSFATPLVAGIAAEILAANPTFNYRQIKDAIIYSCVPTPGIPNDDYVACGGIVNAPRALS